jgi:tRNA and rRNA cytosine-C5-methylases
VQFHDDTEKLKSLEGKMDWILLDVPCTGTGTLRRNPDLKLKFTKERLQYYVTSTNM